jgi:hypothetical protein
MDTERSPVRCRAARRGEWRRPGARPDSPEPAGDSLPITPMATAPFPECIPTIGEISVM